MLILIRCRCGHQFCYVCGTPWRNCNCPQFEEHRLLRRAAEVANRPRRRALEVPVILDGEGVDVEEQQRLLADFQRDAPRHVIQPAQAPGRRNDAPGVDHAVDLVADLRNAQNAYRQARETAQAARNRRFANIGARPALRAADINDIAAHLRENHECTHGPRRWRRFDVGRCEICQRVKRGRTVGECPTCFLQACYYCRRHRMRAGE